MSRFASLCAVLALAAGAVFAEDGDAVEAADAAGAVDAVDADELKSRNEELETRVARLEKANLEKDVEGYLAESKPTIAPESQKILPGGLGISFYGHIKIRPEIRDHIYSAATPQGDASFTAVLNRVRFGANIQVAENVSAVVEIQDTRAWGQTQVTVGNLRGVDLKQGYMKFENLGGSPTAIEAGRMVMSYGAQRIIGALEWLIQGRSFDALRVKYHPEKWWVDGFVATNRETSPFDNADQHFGGFYGGYGKDLDLYAVYLHDDLARLGETGVTGKTHFVTLGARYHAVRGNWDYEVEVPVQFGTFNGDRLEAWAVAAVAGYTFKDTSWTPRVGLELNLASGDQNRNNGKSQQFQVLFPTAHKWYGYVDAVGWSNLINLRLNVSVKPHPNWRITFDYHWFRRMEAEGDWYGVAGNTVRPGVAGTSKDLGQEFDLVVFWSPLEKFAMQGGFGIFLPGDFIEQTGSSPTSNFFYIQALLKF